MIPEQRSTPTAPPAPGEGPLQRGLRYFFGDDIFISYARNDASSYAAALANELQRREPRLAVRIDQWGSTPGKTIPPKLTRAIRRSGMLVAVSSRQGTTSEPMKEEIALFRRTGRPIVLIDLADCIRDACWWPLVEGLHISREGAVDQGRPSEEVIEKVLITRKTDLRSERQNRATGLAAALFVLLLLASLGVLVYAGRKAKEVQRAGRQIEALEGQEKAAKEQVKAEQGKIAGLNVAAASLEERRRRRRLRSLRRSRPRTRPSWPGAARPPSAFRGSRRPCSRRRTPRPRNGASCSSPPRCAAPSARRSRSRPACWRR